MTEREETTEQLVTTNRKARHEFAVLETYEAGIVLTGTEVKSLRQKGVSIADAYGVLRRGELWLSGMHISPYEHGSYANVDPLRERKLLLHRKEIRKLAGRTSQKGLTLVPLKVYFKKNLAKVLIAVARGKRAHDRREDIARREIERTLKRHYAR